MIQGSSNSGYAGWISGGRNANTEVTVDGTSIVLPENNVSIQQLALTPLVDSIEECFFAQKSWSIVLLRSFTERHPRDGCVANPE